MKIQAYGPNVSIQPQKNELEERAGKVGLHIQSAQDRDGAKVRFRRGIVQSLGDKVEHLKKGETVLYNPIDADEFDAHHIVNAGAIVAKLS